MTPAPWKWTMRQGALRLEASQLAVLEARLSPYRPPSIYVRPADRAAIEAVPEMVSMLVDAEIVLREVYGSVTADRIKELLTKIKS